MSSTSDDCPLWRQRKAMFGKKLQAFRTPTPTEQGNMNRRYRDERARICPKSEAVRKVYSVHASNSAVTV